MICCKCKKPIERSYGRVTDLGNYCRECAMQNEIEATKVHNQFVADINKKLNRLAELEDKIENGTLIQLPCKVGDTVFLMAKANENLYYGDYFTVEKIGFDKLGFYVETERGIFRKGNIFLTKAEAEAKLKKIKGGIKE